MLNYWQQLKHHGLTMLLGCWSAILVAGENTVPPMVVVDNMGEYHQNLEQDTAQDADIFTQLSAEVERLEDNAVSRRWPLYVRVGGGYTSDKSLHRIIFGDLSLDNRYTGIATLEVGTPLATELFGWPLDIVAKLGYIRHFERGYQPDFNNYTASVKAYFYGFPWRKFVETRLGFAEGVSYADKVPYVEREHLEDKKEGNTSRFLNYLDVSIDVNLGDITGAKTLKQCYGGFAVVHRSGVFAEVAMFGHVYGGSNYNTLYVECIF